MTRFVSKFWPSRVNETFENRINTKWSGLTSRRNQPLSSHKVNNMDHGLDSGTLKVVNIAAWLPCVRRSFSADISEIDFLEQNR